MKQKFSDIKIKFKNQPIIKKAKLKLKKKIRTQFWSRKKATREEEKKDLKDLLFAVDNEAGQSGKKIILCEIKIDFDIYRFRQLKKNISVLRFSVFFFLKNLSFKYSNQGTIDDVDSDNWYYKRVWRSSDDIHVLSRQEIISEIKKYFGEKNIQRICIDKDYKKNHK